VAKIREPDARVEYLAMGPDRSLEKLHKHLTATSPNIVPSTRTLKEWSSKFEWQAKALEFDNRVAEQAIAKARTKAVNRAADLITEVLDAAAAGLKRCADVAKTEENFRALAEGSVSLLKQAEVLMGGVSDRIEAKVDVEAKVKHARSRVAEIFGVENDGAAEGTAVGSSGGAPLVQ
jgi:acylphosphatase